MHPKPSRIQAIYFFLLSLVLLLGISCGSTGPGGSNGGNDPNTVTEVVTAAGGSVTSSDGKLIITFPPGALANDTEISIVLNEDGTYDLLPSMDFTIPPQFALFPGDAVRQQIMDEVAAMGLTDDNGNPLDLENLHVVAIVFLDGEPLEGVTSDQDECGELMVSGDIPHFSKMDVSYSNTIFRIENPDTVLGRIYNINEQFLVRYIVIGNIPGTKMKIKDDKGNEVEWLVTSVRYNNLTLKNPSNDRISLLSNKVQTKNLELIASSVVRDEAKIQYECDKTGDSYLGGVYDFTFSLGRFGEQPKTIQAFAKGGRRETCGGLPPQSPPTRCQPTAQVEALASEYPISPLKLGAVIPTSCIFGGHRGGADEPGCDCEHLHGTISISGLSDIPDPNPTGCGHGCIVTVDPSKLDYTCD